MKKYTASLIALMIAGSTVSVFAQQTECADGGCGKKDRKAEMLKKYDADGDGQLSQAERQAARDSSSKMNGEKKGRTGGKGNEGKKGRCGQMSPEKRQEILTKYDADGDGQLSDAERVTARAAHQSANKVSE